MLVCAATLGLVATQDHSARGPEAVPEREADTRAITDLLASFVKAYNAQDARAIGALFTPDAEIQDEDGDITRGREAIVKRFDRTFEDRGGALAVDTESLRFLGTDLAIEEGTASLSTGPDMPPRTNRYSVIYAREGGRWLHARIRDEPPDDTSPHERLLELEWMLGEWVNESDDGVVFTTCKWADNGNFLLREFDLKVEGRIALRGTQRIGWDSQREQYRVWVFDDGGGFADGFLWREGDRWIVKGSGVRSDGQSVSFATAITPLGKDRMRWEILERAVGGEVMPDTDRFDLVRRPPDPEK
jgi:uncharacterized protein (TIGR02246 family)